MDMRTSTLTQRHRMHTHLFAPFALCQTIGGVGPHKKPALGSAGTREWAHRTSGWLDRGRA